MLQQSKCTEVTAAKALKQCKKRYFKKHSSVNTQLMKGIQFCGDFREVDAALKQVIINRRRFVSINQTKDNFSLYFFLNQMLVFQKAAWELLPTDSSWKDSQ